MEGFSAYPTIDSTSLATGPRIVIFDCETTGIDTAQDQIIELCVQRGLEPRPDAVQTWRIRPTVEIHPNAQAVHGIAMAELEGVDK